ncbi:MAG TPA: alpha/beta fold hydrolase [Lysobacter sp.]
MASIRRATTLLVITFSLAAIALRANAAPTAAATVPHLAWSDCGDGFQCSTARVPLDHDQPRGRQIELPLIRRLASDRTHRIGSLFFHQGGTGQNVQAIRAFPPFIFDLFPRFDFVGFDQRGVGGSRPAVQACGPHPAFATPMPTPQTVNPPDFVRDVVTYGQRCLQANRDLLPHLSSANVARDLDLLRAAVGDSKLTYFGVSFGTTVGATYASLFPGRARALLLDSAMDVDGYLRRPIRNWLDYTASHEAVLGRFLQACAANPQGCGFGGSDPRDTLDRLMARLRQAPLASDDPAVPGTLTVAHVQLALGKALRRRVLWPLLAFSLAQADAGHAASLLQFAGDNQPSAADDFLSGLYAVDQQYPRLPPSFYFELAEQSHARFPHFGFASGYPDLVHALWPARDQDAYQGPIRNPSWAAPALVIGMTHDPATPYHEAQRLTADLGNARLLTFDADGHFAVGTLDDCVLGHALAYLEAGALPPKGAVCVQQDDPFPAGAAAALRSTAPAAHWPMPYLPRAR